MKGTYIFCGEALRTIQVTFIESTLWILVTFTKKIDMIGSQIFSEIRIFFLFIPRCQILTLRAKNELFI